MIISNNTRHYCLQQYFLCHLARSRVKRFVGFRQYSNGMTQISNQFSEDTTIHLDRGNENKSSILSKSQIKMLKSDEIPIFETIIKTFIKNKSTHLSKNDLLNLHHQLRKDSLQSTIKLIRKAKRIYAKKEITIEQRDYIHKYITSLYQESNLKKNEEIQLIDACRKLEGELSISRKQIYEIAYNQIQKLERVPISQKHREFIHSFLNGKEINFNRIIKYCKELENHLEISRNQIYELLKEEMKRRRKVFVSKETKQRIREILIQSTTDDNFSDLCDKLESELSFPRNQIIKLLNSQFLKLKRSLIKNSHRNSIVENVNKDTIPNDLCNILKIKFDEEGMPLPKKIIYELIIRQQRLLQSEVINTNQKNMIQNMIQNKYQYFILDTDKFSKSNIETIQANNISYSNEFTKDFYINLKEFLLSSLSDKFQNDPIPKIIIYREIDKFIQKLQRVTISTKQKKTIQNLFKNIIQKYKVEDLSLIDVPQLCDEIQKQVPFSRRTIYERIKNELTKLVTQSQITDNHRSFVQSILKKQLENRNLNLVSSYKVITNQFPELSKKQIYRIVREEIIKIENPSLSKEDLINIQKTADENSNLTSRSLYKIISEKFKITKITVRDILEKNKQKQNRKLLSIQTRKNIEKEIFDHPQYFNNVPMLCDIVQEKYNIPRTVLREVIYQSIEKYSKTNIELE